MKNYKGKCNQGYKCGIKKHRQGTICSTKSNTNQSMKDFAQLKGSGLSQRKQKQEALIIDTQNAKLALEMAKNNPNANVSAMQQVVLDSEEPDAAWTAYYFALDVESDDVDIEALKNKVDSSDFKNIQELFENNVGKDVDENCQAVNSKMVLCDAKAKYGNLCGYHIKRKKVETYDQSKAENYIAENIGEFVHGERTIGVQGRESVVSDFIWYNGYSDDSIFEGELELVSDFSHEDEDYVHHSSLNKIDVEKVNVTNYAKQITDKISKVMKIDKDDYMVNLVNHLNEAGAGDPENWDVPYYIEDDHGDEMDDIPYFTNAPDGETLLNLMN